MDEVGTGLLAADNDDILLNCEIGTVRKCRTGIGVNTDVGDCCSEEGDNGMFVGFGLMGGR